MRERILRLIPWPTRRAAFHFLAAPGLAWERAAAWLCGVWIKNRWYEPGEDPDDEAGA